jgi:opacity protein-like surface antigen
MEQFPLHSTPVFRVDRGWQLFAGQVRLRRALLGTSVAIATLGVAGTSALAQSGGAVPYVAFGGGLNFASDPSVTGLQEFGTNTSFPIFVSRLNSFNVGGVGYIAGGLDFRNGWRSELEGSYRRNNGARFNVQAEGSTIIGVDQRTYALMLNVWRDFMLANRLTGHVGGGLGVANRKINVTDSFGTNGSFSKTGGAYQVGAGLDYELIPGLKVTFDYRFFGVFSRASGDLTVLTSCSNGACGSNPGETLLINVASGNTDHSVMLGLRWAIAPAPAP